MSDFLLQSRWAAAVLWVVLHTLDYYLTRWTILLHRKQNAFDTGGSLELNPIMRGAVEGKRHVTVRYVVSLALPAVALFLVQPYAVEEPFFWSFMLGSIVFSRLIVIGNHVRNLAFERGILRGTIRGHLEYDRKKALELSLLRYGIDAFVLLVAALLGGSGWLWGGAAIMIFLELMLFARIAWEWIRRRRRSS